MLTTALMGTFSASAQLAITETFSLASTNNVLTPGDKGPDFWELTNFGSTPVDLTGYRFNDSDASLTGDANAVVFNGVTIAAGESIIFVQSGTAIATRDDFTNWWGAANLPANLQVLFYSGNGQSDTGDSIVLWDAAATVDNDYLDRANFGEATAGRTFSYNTNGAHGLLSTNGVRNAFVAATSDDVGSPGKTAGTIALGFLQQPAPASFTVPAGQNATFTVAAKGLPRARYQWRLGAVAIPNATSASLVITNAQAIDAGQYSCVISNGLQSVISSNATLTVTTGPAAPTFTSTPRDADAFFGQVMQLTSAANGSPTPSFQWLSNNVPLPGQNSPTLSFPSVEAGDAATYTVVISSTSGTNSASAVVTVGPKPLIRITEVQSTGSTGNQDWWELTNFDTNTFNLKGWRWDDSSPSLAPGNAFTFTNDIFIHPGESIVFVENYTAAQFRNWWTNLPASLQIISYTGGGLGLSSSGDQVNIFNAVTLLGNELAERIAGVGFAGSPLLTTFVYDPENPPVSGIMNVFSTNTVNGLVANGMLTAANGAVGSPGRVIAPIQLTNRVAGGNDLLTWNAANNRSYVVEFKPNLTASNWTVLSNLTATSDTAGLTDPVTTSNRFYRAGAVIPIVSQP